MISNLFKFATLHHCCTHSHKKTHLVKAVDGERENSVAKQRDEAGTRHTRADNAETHRPETRHAGLDKAPTRWRRQGPRTEVLAAVHP